MKKWNPRYVAYATAHNRTPEQQLIQDDIDWPGGIMCGFITWHSARLEEARTRRPEFFFMGGLMNHRAYDNWLKKQVEAMRAR